jgi:FkbM family methyltransferase
MKHCLYKLINRLGYRIERKRSREEVWPEHLKFEIKKHKELLFNSKEYIQKIHSRYKELMLSDHKRGFIVSFNGLNFYIESTEEFHILEEIFLVHDYMFDTIQSSIVIDIGANIGISSLFFSQMQNVKAIYAFEPVQETFYQAQYNLSLNKTNKVVSLRNIGLGHEERTEEFIYNRLTKGNTGIRGILSPTMASNSNNEMVTVSIKSATTELQGIIELYPEDAIAIKMDCEGAEYEILENLDKSGLLTKIDVLMLEWHDKGSDVIEKVLINNGFTIFSTILGENAGIIYASNSRSKL